jgi:hypothetical protein
MGKFAYKTGIQTPEMPHQWFLKVSHYKGRLES